MAMKQLGMILALCALGVAIGDSPAKHPPTTQLELNEEAVQSLKAAEREMVVVLDQLRARTSAQPENRAVLETSQSAWAAYRDAQLNAMWPFPAKDVYGSVNPMCVALARTEITKRRTAELKSMLKFVEGEACNTAWSE